MPKIETGAARASLHLLHAALVQAERQSLRIAVEAAERHARETTLFQDRSPTNDNNPAATGTRGTIHGQVFGDRGFVEARGAAVFLEGGTRPHLIEARGGALRFTVNGVTLFRRSVNHPGTAPRPFMHQAREHGEKVLAETADTFVNYAIARA